MAYDEHLAERVRAALTGRMAVVEKKMMGGLTFMVNDKMCIGVLNDDLMIRLDSADYDVALTRKGCREMDFTGKPMRGFVFVGPQGVRRKRDMHRWLGMALAFNKKATTSKTRSRQAQC